LKLLLRYPADSAVTRHQFERLRLSTNQSKPSVSMLGNMVQALTDNAMKPEIVMLLHQTFPELMLARAVGPDAP